MPLQNPCIPMKSEASRIRQGRIPLIGLFCAIAACSTPETSLEQYEHHHVTLTEVMRLGDESAGDTSLFSPISHLAVNSRGEFIVTEFRPAIVSVFRPDGSFLAAVGTEGEGPGEYRYISRAIVGPADSVYVLESLRNRVMVYDPQSFAFVRHANIVDEGQRQTSQFVGVHGDRWLVAVGLPAILERDDGSIFVNDDDHRELRTVSLDGEFGPDIVATVRSVEQIYHVYEESGGFGWTYVPFGRHSTYEVGPNGLLHHGWSDSIRISLTAFDGTAAGTISYDHEPVPISDAEMEEAKYEKDELWQRLVDERATYKVKAAFETFVVDDAGRAWIKLSSAEGATDADWLILNRQSELMYSTSLPVEVDLKVVREDRAYALEEQEGARIIVVVYEIEK